MRGLRRVCHAVRRLLKGHSYDDPSPDQNAHPSRHVGALLLALAWVCRQVDGLRTHKCSSAASTVEKDDGHHNGRYQDEEQ